VAGVITEAQELIRAVHEVEKIARLGRTSLAAYRRASTGRTVGNSNASSMINTSGTYMIVSLSKKPVLAYALHCMVPL
jgi:hypothetical protein